MPTASDLLLNLKIEIDGEKGLKTLGEELKALEAEQFKYNKQAQQGTVITEKVEAATRKNKQEFQRIRAEVGQQIVANRGNQEVLNDLNKAHGLLSDQIRMAQATIRKYGAETIAASDKQAQLEQRQQKLADTTKELRNRFQAIRDRAADLQRSMKGSSEATAEQTLEFKRISNRSKELERDAQKLAKTFGNNRQEVNAYRKIAVDVRGVQSKLNATFSESDSEFARLTKRIAGINKEVNRLRSEFFESDLRAKELVNSETDLAAANKIVEEQNKRNVEVMRTQRVLLRDLRDEVDALTKSQSISASESEKLSKQLNSATQNAGVSQRTLQDLNGTFGTSNQVTNRATQALIAFSQGLQDAPQFTFGLSSGIRAIANNMTQFQQMVGLLGESIAQTTGKTATFGQKLMALLKALKGPAGGLILFTALTTVITVVTARMDKARKKTEGLSTSLDDLTSVLTGYQSVLGGDEFGVDNLILQKEALEDIQGSYEKQLDAVKRIKNETGFLQKALEQTLRVAQGVIGPAGVTLIEQPISAEQFEGLGFGEAESLQLQSFTREQQNAVLALKESRDALEEQARRVGVSVKEIDELENKVNQLNNQIEINNRLAALRPLGQRISELNRQAALLEIDAEFGEVSIQQAKEQIELIQEQRKETKNLLDQASGAIELGEQLPIKEYEALSSSIQSSIKVHILLSDQIASQNVVQHTANDLLVSNAENVDSLIKSNSQLTAEQSDYATVLDSLNRLLGIYQKVLDGANDETQRQIDLEKEKNLLTIDTQTALARTIAEGIENERDRARTLFDIELAALNRRTALRQGVAEEDIQRDEEYINQLVSLRIDYHNDLRAIDQNELSMAETVRQKRFDIETRMLKMSMSQEQFIRVNARRQAESQVQALRDQGINNEALFQSIRVALAREAELEITQIQLSEEEKRKNAQMSTLSSIAQGTQRVFGNLMQLSQQRANLSEEAARREFNNQKALSYASAVVSGAEAIVKASPNPLLMSLAAATTATQLAVISAQRFEASGSVSAGNGFETEFSVSDASRSSLFGSGRNRASRRASDDAPYDAGSSRQSQRMDNMQVTFEVGTEVLYGAVKDGQLRVTGRQQNAELF